MNRCGAVVESDHPDRAELPALYPVEAVKVTELAQVHKGDCAAQRHRHPGDGRCSSVRHHCSLKVRVAQKFGGWRRKNSTRPDHIDPHGARAP